MKIIVCGLPKTGKTTFCKQLKQQMPNANLVVTEALRNGFQAMQPEQQKEWGNKASVQRRTLFPVFVKEFINWNEQFSNCHTILDAALLTVQEAVNIAEKDDFVVCFGFGGKSLDEMLKNIRKYEKAADYTINFSNGQLLKFWGNLEDEDMQNIKFCENNSVLYVDATNREEVFNVVFSKLNCLINK